VVEITSFVESGWWSWRSCASSFFFVVVLFVTKRISRGTFISLSNLECLISDVLLVGGASTGRVVRNCPVA